MTVQKPGCFICHKEGTLLFSEGRDYFVFAGNSPAFDVRVCRDCRVGWTSPPMTVEELDRYYPEDYEAYQPKKGLHGFLQGVQYRKDLRRLTRAMLKSGSRLLFEIGAGRGEFLSEAKKLGFEVAGLEASKTGVRIAKERYGIDLEQRFAKDFHLKKPQDAVVLRYVLEHIDDPMGCLLAAYAGLKENGVLFLKLPRLDCWEARVFGKFWIGLDLPRHRFHFEAEGIRHMLQMAGFKDIQIHPEIIPLDASRSLKYFATYGPEGFWKKMASAPIFLGQVFTIMLATIAAFLLAPWQTSRMVVTARK